MGPSWFRVVDMTAEVLSLVQRFVPNRYEELVGSALRYGRAGFRHRWQPEEARDSAFGVIAAPSLFFGHADFSECPGCDLRSDLTLLDARFLLFIQQTCLLLHGFIDPAQQARLGFLELDSAGVTAAEYLAQTTLDEKNWEIVVPNLYIEPDHKAHAFLAVATELAILWTTIHETSHVGPGTRGGLSVETKLRWLAEFAHQHNIQPRRQRAWAEELSTDGNAFAMARVEIWQALRLQVGDRAEQAWWDAALLAGALLSLALLYVVHWYRTPSDRGVPYRAQVITVQHPPAELRINALIEQFHIGVAQGLYQDSDWKNAAYELVKVTFRLFGLMANKTRQKSPR